ncbi:DUF1622 domain-containing protein [Persicitalea jodogahamensis]|uniref:DUF1622 domain-containing protein n=1 Tax=Persicitalea jodogahamensis TaxID=402147 RepID=A0A8J3D425_9BACT|nr:DUF1622 domain-containing protein [Persicitalea jodogahamensis]GHB71572.1 hypothetical protein GCM10007390_26770 [Persicitalea jodogahamensis]
MQELAEIVTKHLSAFIEILAAVVIGVALLQFLYAYILNFTKPNSGRSIQDIRIRFGSSLTVSLELLLGADILATAIAPTWDEIGKLAAIATLRTALNYFLERELKNSGENDRIGLTRNQADHFSTTRTDKA